MFKKIKIYAQCSFCGGTGIYNRFISYTEPNDVGLICRECSGSGKMIIEYIPFTKRQPRNDINIVRNVLSGNGVSYKDFLAGRKPLGVQ